MENLPESMLFEGVNIDISFPVPRPRFGDLFLICGERHPRFPPTGDFGFEALVDLQFDQVDDYSGIRSRGDGDDVVIWVVSDREE